MKAFSFVKIKELPPKPRNLGLTEIRGSYYTVVTPTYLKELLDIAGEYVDIFKYAGGSMRLHQVGIVKKINSMLHDYGVEVSTGGFTERVLVQGPEAFYMYLEEAKDLGFDIVEVSSGFIEIDEGDRIEIVKAIKKTGLKAKPEITLVKGAGGGLEEWETEGLPYEHMIRDAKLYLEAGAYMVMVESEGITEGVRKPRWDVVEALVREFGLEKLMFEAAERPVFRWYIYTFGPHVNLFIDHSQILEVTALRTELWAPKKPWGKVYFTKRP